MSIPTLLFIIALVLSVIELARSNWRSLLAGAVVLVCAGLLWGSL
jgi:hypothetical protein